MPPIDQPLRTNLAALLRGGRRPGRVAWRNAGVLLLALAALSVNGHASGIGGADGGDSQGSAWERARSALMVERDEPMCATLERWKLLTSTTRFGFADYAGFVLSWPGFPLENQLRRSAEAALAREAVEPRTLVTFFDRFPPLTNPARARYALALAALGRPDAAAMARAAWRGGIMADADETALRDRWAATFTADDADARSDALCWQGADAAAMRALADATPGRREIDAARLGAAQVPLTLASGGSTAASDPGWLYTGARLALRRNDGAAAVTLLAGHPPLARLPFDRGKWVDLNLAVARIAADRGDWHAVVAIAGALDQAFAVGEDVSATSYDLRDDYTSLAWLGATAALWQLNDRATAAALFDRYARAARTPGTRAKGQYWAGIALRAGGHGDEAFAAFTAAARAADQFYGLLAREQLGLNAPQFAAASSFAPDAAARAQFDAQPLTQATREAARDRDWHTTVRFFKAIAEAADTPAAAVLVTDLAQRIGRRDLAVIAGNIAEEKGLGDFAAVAFPVIPLPAAADHGWTMIHAITRQESQFAENAISRVGARGLMQVMPQTGGVTGARLGLGHVSAGALEQAETNLLVGDALFDRLLAEFNGAVPLAVAAYNAGPGNVRRWLRSNGDPRTGTVDWVTWVERIPFGETRNYVEHVLENAVVYEALHPERARWRGPAPLTHWLTTPFMG